MRGIIDSADLPLNVLREILQQSRDVAQMKAASTKRVLGLLDDLAANQSEKYAAFWSTFGRVLKEGVVDDAFESMSGSRSCFALRPRMPRTTIRPSTWRTTWPHEAGPGDGSSIMRDGRAAARHSPHLEIFRKLGVEVLLMYDRVDE